MKKHAFTLSEVLITLGIIGVVAALTIPALITNYQKKVDKTALQKAYSTVNQAYERIKSVDEYENVFSDCTENDSHCMGELFKAQMHFVKIVEGIPNSTNLEGCWNSNIISMPHELQYCAISPDGIIYDFDMEYHDCASGYKCGYVNIDTNGLKKPNLYGRDRFTLTIYQNKMIPYNSPLCNYGKTNDIYNNSGCAQKYLIEN